jgi:3',5'-cyclic AMP phosphodiesterase CpdA
MKKILLYILVLFFATNLNVCAKTIKIAQVSDVDLSTQNESAQDSQKYLEAVVKSINSQKGVDFVVFTGNNIDKSEIQNLQKFGKMTKKLKRPYYIVMGNKDAHKIGGITKLNYMKMVKAFNKNQSTAFNYDFALNNDIKAVFLDGVPPNVIGTHGYFSEDTMKWLKKFLANNKNKRIIIFQHHPIVPPTDDPHYTVLEPEQYQMMLIRNPNILFVAAGHYDVDSVKTDENGITHISTPSLLTSKKYRIIEIDYKDSPLGKPCDFKINTQLMDI